MFSYVLRKCCGGSETEKEESATFYQSSVIENNTATAGNEDCGPAVYI